MGPYLWIFRTRRNYTGVEAHWTSFSVVWTDFVARGDSSGKTASSNSFRWEILFSSVHMVVGSSIVFQVEIKVYTSNKILIIFILQVTSYVAAGPSSWRKKRFKIERMQSCFGMLTISPLLNLQTVILAPTQSRRRGFYADPCSTGISWVKVAKYEPKELRASISSTLLGDTDQG